MPSAVHGRTAQACDTNRDRHWRREDITPAAVGYQRGGVNSVNLPAGCKIGKGFGRSGSTDSGESEWNTGRNEAWNSDDDWKTSASRPSYVYLSRQSSAGRRGAWRQQSTQGEYSHTQDQSDGQKSKDSLGERFVIRKASSVFGPVEPARPMGNSRQLGRAGSGRFVVSKASDVFRGGYGGGGDRMESGFQQRMRYRRPINSRTSSMEQEQEQEEEEEEEDGERRPAWPYCRFNQFTAVRDCASRSSGESWSEMGVARVQRIESPVVTSRRSTPSLLEEPCGKNSEPEQVPQSKPKVLSIYEQYEKFGLDDDEWDFLKRPPNANKADTNGGDTFTRFSGITTMNRQWPGLFFGHSSSRASSTAP